MLTVGSLFSGIGGLELGLERAGMKTIWQVERDEFCRRVLRKHWPDVRQHDDVCTWPEPDAERPDVICGGFPCQDISTAGHGTGLQGSRSGLWFEMLRIIRAMGPRYVVVENVAALLARGFGTVLGGLADSGYDAEWEELPAKFFGAPHQRKRLFIVAYANGQGREGCDRIFSFEPYKDMEETPWHLSVARSNSGRIRVVPPPTICRMDDGLPDTLDRLKSCGNSVSPRVSEYVGRCIVAHADKE